MTVDEAAEIRAHIGHKQCLTTARVDTIPDCIDSTEKSLISLEQAVAALPESLDPKVAQSIMNMVELAWDGIVFGHAIRPDQTTARSIRFRRLVESLASRDLTPCDRETIAWRLRHYCQQASNSPESCVRAGSTV
jgi:hypothetical protein